MQEFQWLSDLPKGTIVFLGDIIRVGIVEDTTGHVVVQDRKPDGNIILDKRPAIKVRVGIPTKGITGLLSDQDAKNNSAILGALKNYRGISEWTEIWAERSIGKMVNIKNSRAVERSEVDMIPQVYVHSVENVPEGAMRASGIIGKGVIGQILPSIPDGVFTNTETMIPKDGILGRGLNLPETRDELRTMAQEMDIDLSGAGGSIKDMQARITEAIQKNARAELASV